MFAGAVHTGDFVANHPAADGTIVGARFVYAKRASNNSTVLFRGYKGTDVVFKVEDDGFATFDGDVQSGGDANGGTADGVRLRSSGIVQAARASSTNNIWTGYTTGSATPTSTITAGGAANFSSRVSSTTDNVNVSCFKATHTGSNAKAVEVFNSSGRTVSIEASGSAAFNGDVQSASQNGYQLAGNRNQIINGNFAINQRGGGPFPAGTGYTSDRWIVDSGAVVTV